MGHGNCAERWPREIRAPLCHWGFTFVMELYSLLTLQPPILSPPQLTQHHTQTQTRNAATPKIISVLLADAEVATKKWQKGALTITMPEPFWQWNLASHITMEPQGPAPHRVLRVLAPPPNPPEAWQSLGHVET